MSLIGKEIADFKVQAYHNNSFVEVKKQDLLGKWTVLFFYPADFTFVCPTELADIADIYDKFQAANCEVYGVSTDSHFVHKAWHESSELVGKVNYPLIGDPNARISRDLEVYVEDAGQAERGTFIINPSGEVVAYEVVAGNIGRNAEELLRRVYALQFVAAHGDEVCPARWTPGAKTLKPGYDMVGSL